MSYGVPSGPLSITRPATRASGTVSCIRLRQRSRVDLPHPDGPMIAVTCPWWKSTDTPRTASFGGNHAVRGVSVDFHQGQVTAIIGPSGCGKSTLLRCLNRMHETVPEARV